MCSCQERGIEVSAFSHFKQNNFLIKAEWQMSEESKWYRMNKETKCKKDHLQKKKKRSKEKKHFL